MSEHRHVLIIGSGPAGRPPRTYAVVRLAVRPLVIEGEPSSTSDGAATPTTEENFPGFPEGVMGPQLMKAGCRAQAERFEASRRCQGDRVELAERPFRIWVGDPDAAEPTYTADAVIVSTGAQSWMLGSKREPPHRSRPVDLRHMRRLLLPGTPHRGGRWRRLGHRGGDLPHEVRGDGDDRPPARRVRASMIMQTVLVPTPRSSSVGTPSSRTSSAQGRQGVLGAMSLL